jgi:hypothetical protein
MKRIQHLAFSTFVVICIMFFSTCDRPDKGDIVFAGKVVDRAGKPIADAKVQIGESELTTGNEGEFKMGVKKSDRYVLNVDKFGFGMASKVYYVSTRDILITLAKATVIKVSSNDAIDVQDTKPDMTIPASTNPPPPSSPLDTLSFVYDKDGQLESFIMPQALRDAYKAVGDFTPPQRGARIVVPAQSLVVEGTTQPPTGDIELAINTIDLYAEDGMPGDYTTDLGEGKDRQRSTGFMVTYGASNVDVVSQGKSLQLAAGKKAMLTIPVDTLSILSKEALPNTIPFLVYNKATGRWQQEGDAVLDPATSTYSKEITHFSTFNLDMVFVDVACYRVTNNTTGGGLKEIEITVPTKTKKLTMGASACATPNLHAIINLTQDTPVGVKVLVGGVIKSTYVFHSGPEAYNTSAQQICEYTSCAPATGPLALQDTECWMRTSAPLDRMQGPVLAVSRTGDNFKFSWIYLDAAATGTPLTNPAATSYTIEHITITNQNTALDLSDAGWTNVSISGSETIPTTAWKVDRDVTIAGVSTTDPVLFRVKVTTDGASYVSSAIRLLNPAAISVGSQFETDFLALSCGNVGQPVN